MSQKKNKPSYIDGQLAFAQLPPDAQQVIAKAALRKHLSECGKRSNNQCLQKRAIIAAAQRRRWQQWREQREAARQAEIAKHGYPPDWQFPPKPKKTKSLTRREAMEILFKEYDRKFPQGMTKENEAEFMAYRSKDPRVQKYL